MLRRYKNDYYCYRCVECGKFISKEQFMKDLKYYFDEEINFKCKTKKQINEAKIRADDVLNEISSYLVEK